MQVLLLDSGKSWGGGQNQVLHLAEGLKDIGVKVYVAAPAQSPLRKKLSQNITFLSFNFGFEFNILYAWKLAKFCRKNNITIVNAHCAKSHGLALLSKLFFKNLNIVVHRHVEFPIKKNIWAAYKYATDKIRIFIAVSQGVKKCLIQSKISASKIVVINGGVDEKPFLKIDKLEAQKKIRKQFNILDSSRVLIGGVGRLTDQKNFLCFIEALYLLKQSKKNILAVIVGEGEKRQELEKKINSLDMQEDIFLLGFQADVAPFMAAFDIFVLSSVMEGLGLVLIEAALAKTLIVCSNLESVKDIVIHNKTGLLFESNNPKELALTIQHAIDNFSQFENMKDEAFQLAYSHFSRSRMAREFFNLCQQF